MLTKILLSLYGLPTAYEGITLKDTDIPSVKQESLKEKLKKAPSSGTLTIQGTAAPVVNLLAEQGRKIRGICFTDRSQTAFESHTNPIADVVVLYDIGAEVSMNGKVSGMVLANIVKFYSKRPTLLVLETDIPKAGLLQKYDFNVTNFVKIPSRVAENWI